MNGWPQLLCEIEKHCTLKSVYYTRKRYKMCPKLINTIESRFDVFTVRRQFTFNHLSPKSFWDLFDRLWKDERMNCACNQPVISHSQSNTLTTQPAFTCSKLTIEALKQGVEYVQNSHFALVFLLLTLNR